ncbi:hypothetical protein WEH80_00605 [Actinomycetes bacterium KLBMP 9759]
MNARNYRAYGLYPGTPLEVEIHGADGTRLLVRGTIDSVPWAAAGAAQKVVLRDAIARPLDA